MSGVGLLFPGSPPNKLGRQRKKQQSLIDVRMVAKTLSELAQVGLG